jgi:hypothetical protein
LICLDSLCKVTRGKKPEAKWQSDHLAALTDELEEERERERERERQRERERVAWYCIEILARLIARNGVL